MPHTILYYSDSTSFGGAEQYLLTVLKTIDRNIWQPALIYHPYKDLTSFVEQARELDVDTYPVPEIRGYTDFKNMYKFTSQLKSLRPSIFHANINWPLSCSYGIVGATLARVKIRIATQHLYKDLRSRRSYLLQRTISGFVNRYIAVSHDIAKHMKELISPSIKVNVIHNGIIMDDYSTIDNKETKGYILRQLGETKLPIVLNVARLHTQKGQKYLLKAASMIDNAVFVLAGDGPEKSSLKSYAKELSIEDRVIFLGYRDDIAVLINMCSIFVLPSLYEGLPLTILEAMAAGKPVIASDLIGIREEVIHNKTGLLVPKEDPEALADAIKELLSDPCYAQRLGDAAGLRARQEFSAEKMTSGITDIYKDLLNIAR